MLLCAFCEEEAAFECLWCEGVICIHHSHALQMGDETAIVPVRICFVCRDRWRMFASMAKNEEGIRLEDPAGKPRST